MNSKAHIKLLCLDIDGTLLDKNRDISLATSRVFSKLDPEIKIILASSRMPSAMYYIQQKLNILGAPLIAYNGGLILGESQKILKSTTLSIALLAAVIAHNKNHNYNISIFCGDVWRTATMDQWTKHEIMTTRVQPQLVPLSGMVGLLDANDQHPHKVMCMGEEQQIDALLAHMNDSGFNEQAHFYRSKKTYLEISPKHIDKSSALQFLMEGFKDIKMQNVMAFGDNHNDMELIRHAGYGIAVANATSELKKIADRVSAFTNRENAVAQEIKELLQ